MTLSLKEYELIGSKLNDPSTLTLEDLLLIMRALRTPPHGCPWDLKQDFASIAPYTIEEAYEVADAIEQKDMLALEEELGDLLLQVVFHAQMAQEQDLFSFENVVDGIARKMLRRHPHIFANEEARDAVDVKNLWERIKREEKRLKAERRQQQLTEPEQLTQQEQAAAQSDTQPAEKPPSHLDDIPNNFPALLRAEKLQKRAAQVGFDWPNSEPVLQKVKEEISELEAELTARPELDEERQAGIKEEYGDLLFVLVNLGRHLNVSAEDALKDANLKFTRRFHHIEEQLQSSALSLEQADLDLMEKYWTEAKENEKKLAKVKRSENKN